MPLLCFSQSMEVKYSVYSKLRKSEIDKVKNNKKNQEYGSFLSGIDAEREDSFLLVIKDRLSSYERMEPDEELTDDAGPSIVLVSPGYSEEEHSTYKDMNHKSMTEVKDFQGKAYTIETPMPDYRWKILKESKDIMGLKCYKATLQDSVVAWFCPEIPVNEGPNTYCGLPGIILDLEDGTDIYRCIGINTRSAKNVAPVRKGKQVTAKEFEDIKRRFFNK